MKDYRSFRRYQPEEWENDKEWLAKRMSFLWDMRNYYFDVYKSNDLHVELQCDMYPIHGSDNEIHRLATKDNSYGKNDFKNWSNWTIDSLYKNYIRLKELKNNNKKEFLKKCNCYLYTFILEQRWDDILDYQYNGGGEKYGSL